MRVVVQAKVAFSPHFNAGEIVLAAVKSFHPSEREHSNFFLLWHIE